MFSFNLSSSGLNETIPANTFMALPPNKLFDKRMPNQPMMC